MKFLNSKKSLNQFNNPTYIWLAKWCRANSTVHSIYQVMIVIPLLSLIMLAVFFFTRVFHQELAKKMKS